MFKVREDHYRLPCTCGMTEHNLDLIVDGTDFFISIGASQKDTSLWKRIKLAWKVLTKGEACFAEVVLDPQQVGGLGAYLQKQVTKEETNEFLKHK